MPIKEQQIFKRAEATLDVMKTLHDGPSHYQWPKASVSDFKREFDNVRALQIAEANSKSAFEQQRGLVNSRFDALESRMIQGIGMATQQFRNSPEKAAQIQALRYYGVAREDILNECEDWLAIWSSIRPSWNPTPQNTLDGFVALLHDAKVQLLHLAKTRAEARQASIDLSIALAKVEELCVGWYESGTETFIIGTREGDMIRAQIPTFEHYIAPSPIKSRQ